MQPYDREDREAQSIGSRESVYLLINAPVSDTVPELCSGICFFLEGLLAFFMGDDWAGKFDYLKDEGVEVVYLSRTPEVSTTQIKNDLNSK